MEKINANKLGERLKEAREYLNLTQEQVAKILDIGRDAIIRIEKGTRKITSEELLNFSKLYNISINELLNNNEELYYSNQAFARGFEKLSEQDKKEIINLIKLKNEIKSQGE